MKKTDLQKIPILDLNHAAFQKYYGNEPDLEMQGSRGVFLFNPDQRFFELSEKYNRNELIPALDFVNCQRQLKAELIAAKRGSK